MYHLSLFLTKESEILKSKESSSYETLMVWGAIRSRNFLNKNKLQLVQKL